MKKRYFIVTFMCESASYITEVITITKKGRFINKVQFAKDVGNGEKVVIYNIMELSKKDFKDWKLNDDNKKREDKKWGF